MRLTCEIKLSKLSSFNLPLPVIMPQSVSIVEKVFRSPPAYDEILSSLSPRSLVRVGQTCRLISAAVACYFPRAFSINRHLSPWFDDPIAFRSLQARTGMLISGSNALQFLDRSHYPGSDLDLYVSHWHSLEMGLWLVEQGWVFHPHKFQDEDLSKAADALTSRSLYLQRDPEGTSYYFAGVASVFTFWKGNLKLQLIAAKHTPLECILGFHSSMSFYCTFFRGQLSCGTLCNSLCNQYHCFQQGLRAVPKSNL